VSEAQEPQDSNDPFMASGPLVWVTTILSTTILLALLRHALWIVVPFLLAIILYYVLLPAVSRLAVAGVASETAAGIVTGLFFVLGVAAMVPTIPWIVAQAAENQDTFLRYVEGGQALLDRTLLALEGQFGFLQRMGIHDEVGRKMSEFGGSYLEEHLSEGLLEVAAWLPALLLAPFIAFFFLRDGRRFLKFAAEAVPNAYFERTIFMIDRVDHTARAYFQGLLKLTVLDTLCLAIGLALIGMRGAFVLGLLAAVLAWIPFVGSVVGCIIVVLVAATDFPGDPWIVYKAIGLFLLVRVLDDFVFMPLTLGRSLHMHPLVTVMLIFIGGELGGVPGLVLVLPLAGVVMTVAGTVGGILKSPRLRARHAFARTLRMRRITSDLDL
jgi:predicted PurR-regulated permease PerM